jgi:S1-C subfamily serine protease
MHRDVRSTILRVTENTPAFEAGLREQDVITTINDMPASKFTLEKIRQMFTRKGQTYRVKFKRGEETRQTKINLRALI